MSPRRRQRSRGAGVQRTSVDVICRDASGVPVSAAFARLGPVTGVADSLYDASKNDVAAALAAEQLVHLLDGWKYASAAFGAYLTNSRAAATHFAYYAELRSALSLFAGAGIRLKQGDSFYLDSTGAKHEIQGETRTHTITWNVWQKWIKRIDAIELLTRHVRLISAVTLGDFSGSTNVATFALQQWGYDLFSLSNDHKARNIASYEPSVGSPLRAMTDEDAKLIRRIWGLLLPTEHGVGFDTSLIYFLVSKTATDWSIADTSKTLEEHRDAMIKAAAVQTGVEAAVIRSLLVDSNPDIGPFQKAAEPVQEVDNVLCRALFLLRMATLSVANSMTAGVPDHAANWLRNWLSNGGLYEDREVDPRDLSEDYRLAWESFFESGSTLPNTLWNPLEPNLPSSSRLARPDAFVAWAIAL